MITEITLAAVSFVLFIMTAINCREISDLRARLRDSKIVWGEQTRATSADVFGLTQEMRLYNLSFGLIRQPVA